MQNNACPHKHKEELPYSKFKGTLQFGGVEFEAHVLNDLRRVLTQREVVRILSDGRESGNLTRYLDRNPLIDTGLLLGPTVRFQIPGSRLVGTGYEGVLLIEICDKYIEAYEQGLLKESQH